VTSAAKAFADSRAFAAAPEALRHPKAELFCLRAGLLHHFDQGFSRLCRVAHFA
jgi:hypothetical protein